MSRLQIKANAKRKLSLNLMPVILLWALPLVLMAWIQSQTYASIAMTNDMITFNVPTQFVSITICLVELIVVFTSIQTLKYSRSQEAKDGLRLQTMTPLITLKFSFGKHCLSFYGLLFQLLAG